MPNINMGMESIQENRIEKTEALTTEVILEIFRHSKKENDPNRHNSELLLTVEGRELAQKRGKELNPNSNVAVAGASSMDRAAETAMLVMLANEDEIKVTDSLEDMAKKIAEEVKVGKKLYRDDRLGFDLSGPIHDEGMQSFKEGWYLKWLSENSDQQAIEKNDKISTTYLRQAGNIAELVSRYLTIGNNFNRITNEKKKEAEKVSLDSEDKEKKEAENFPLHLERYLASHQGVPECFMAEVLKIQKGEDGYQKFLDGLGNGWAETKGMSFRIINQGQNQSIILSYFDKGDQKEIEVSPETIFDIIGRRSEFEDKLVKANASK